MKRTFRDTSQAYGPGRRYLRLVIPRRAPASRDGSPEEAATGAAFFQAVGLAVEQRADVFEQLIGADGAVAEVFDQAADDLIRLLELFGVRCSRRCRNLDHIAQVGEELLLDGLFQALVAAIIERLATTRERRDTNQNLLAEGL